MNEEKFRKNEEIKNIKNIQKKDKEKSGEMKK